MLKSYGSEWGFPVRSQVVAFPGGGGGAPLAGIHEDPRWSPESTGPSRAGFKAVPNQGEAWRWRRRAWRRSRSLPLSNGPPAGPFDGGESRLPLRLLLLLPMPVLVLGPALALNCGRRFLGDRWGRIG